jgi:hypothetical protein
VNVCANTGLTVPECSCGDCVRTQIATHMPALLSNARLIRPTPPEPSAGSPAAAGEELPVSAGEELPVNVKRKAA